MMTSTTGMTKICFIDHDDEEDFEDYDDVEPDINDLLMSMKVALTFSPRGRHLASEVQSTSMDVRCGLVWIG